MRRKARLKRAFRLTELIERKTPQVVGQNLNVSPASGWAV